MIAIRGASSVIAQSLVPMLPEGETVAKIGRHERPPLEADRYLFCQGVINPRSILQQGDVMIAETFMVNAGRVIRDCERILEANDRARIVVIGSESGFTGSFDGAYAASKAALHSYVETKRLRSPTQQLVCIAPTIIRVSGMTLARADLEDVDRRGREHPKRRWLTPGEVARLVHFCLYQDEGYLTGVVIRMNGGGSGLS
jgi:NAD(P)-dependent dehydrogenase (short-subunit alcohol dehydrogenase family)